MSDNMEREKNERTAREIEEEKMKRELIDIGIYESRFTYKDMKKLLGFLNESEATSNITSDNKNVQKGNGQHSDKHLPEITSETDGLHEQVAIQERVDVSRSMYSYRTNRTSPTVTHERKSSCYSSSPETSSIFDTRSSVYRHKSSDSDETEKQNESAICAHNTNRYKSGNVSQECQNTTDMKTVQNTAQSEHNQRLERWRLNPFDVCVNENDVPLRQPSRSPARERVPFGYCKELMHTSEQRDQQMQALSQHLRDMADLWFSWHRPTDSKFQWGSPIQVGTPNGSLDRKPLTEPKTELIKMDCTYKDSHERASKRKAYSFIANLNTESSTDEDDQYAFDHIKKKRIQTRDKSSNVDRVNQHSQTNAHETTSAAYQQCAVNDSNSNTNNEDIKSLYCGRKIEDEENERLSPELATNSRRIIPPTPKTRLILSRHRKGNVTSKPSPKSPRTDSYKDIKQPKNWKKDDSITKEGIRRKFEENSDEEIFEATMGKDMKTRSSMSREVKSKLQEKQLLANINTETVEDARMMSKERENDKRRRRKLEFGEQRKNEENLCRTENRSWESQLLDSENDTPDLDQESDVQNSNRRNDDSTSANRISCPICNKLFPPDKIESHAADCEQFQTVNDEDEYICTICDNYKAINGKEYEEHIHQCINSKRNKRHLRGSENVDIVSISSSFRTNETNERKAVSSSPEINCMDQLPCHSRTRIFTGRKRKH